jgi:hypothetical protein
MRLVHQTAGGPQPDAKGFGAIRGRTQRTRMPQDRRKQSRTTCSSSPITALASARPFRLPSPTGLWMLPDLWTAPSDAPPTRSLEIAARFPQHPQPKPKLSSTDLNATEELQILLPATRSGRV